MVIREEDSREKHVLEVAKSMMTAARTAPKGCGIDHLEMAVLTGEDINRLAAEMRRLGELHGRGFFLRDADNVENSQAVVLIGCHSAVRNLNCGLCGSPTCREKQTAAPAVPCTFDVTDLGIAVGSAVAMAADFRIDNRILYSAGVTAREMKFLPDCSIVYAIPLSVNGKSIYFDRASKCQANK